MQIYLSVVTYYITYELLIYTKHSVFSRGFVWNMTTDWKILTYIYLQNNKIAQP